MSTINFEEARLSILKKRHISQIRKLGEFIEYCVIPDYDEILDFESIDRLPVCDTEIQLAKVSSKRYLASVLFHEDEYNLDNVLNWLTEHRISFFTTPKDSYLISHASFIIDKFIFEDCVLALYRKGHTVFQIDHSDLEDAFRPTGVDYLVSYDEEIQCFT